MHGRRRASGCRPSSCTSPDGASRADEHAHLRRLHGQHELPAQLNNGQRTQLRMQATVEGLSIAAITYYVVSLLLYFFKALKAEGWLPFSPELAAGAAIPVMLLAVWRTTRRIHRRFFHH